MIIYIYGEDTFRSRKKLKEMKDRFLEKFDPGGESLVVLDGETVNKEKINESFAPISLFSKRRMVVIENIFLNKNAELFEFLIQYLKNKESKVREDDNIIIFWDAVPAENLSKKKAPAKKVAKKDEFINFLKKQKFSYSFKAFSNTETAEWIRTEVKQRGGKITREASVLLFSLAGNDLWRINNELDKLINFKTAQQLQIGEGEAIIQEEDIKRFVKGQFDENIFALTDALSAKNKREAVRLLEEQLGGLSESYVLTMIERQFKIMLQVKVSLENGLAPTQISASLKLHPFVAQKAVNQVRNFSITKLREILNELVEVDFLMKKGMADINSSLGLLIGKLA